MSCKKPILKCDQSQKLVLKKKKYIYIYIYIYCRKTGEENARLPSAWYPISDYTAQCTENAINKCTHTEDSLKL